jgi:hypothetical protein
MQILVPILFGIGLIAFGLVTFVRARGFQLRLEGRLQNVRTGAIPPDRLIVIQKYVDPGKGASPHIVFSQANQPNVNIAATRDFYNSVKLGDSIAGYRFPEGYFIPQNNINNAGSSSWFVPFLSFILGSGVLVVFLKGFARKTFVRGYPSQNELS